MTMTAPALRRRSLLVLAAAPALGRPARAATALRIGILHTLSPAPLYIAMDRGYFRDTGLDASFRYFQAAQPIAAAAVAGDIDVGVTALTGGFFALAGRGALRVIGGGLHEEKGIEGTALLASDRAFDAGLTTPAKLAGQSVGITQFGSSFQYMVGRIAEVEHFDPKSVTLRPLQGIGNMIAAIGTNQIDATFAIASQAKPLVRLGKAHLLAWVGDLFPYQLTAAFTTERMVAQHAAALHGFADAYKRGVNDYRAAFFRRQPDGSPVRDAKTDAAIANIEKFVFTGDPNARQKILSGLPYYNADGALDVADVRRQIAWFKAQGLVKVPVDPAKVINTSFLPVLHA
jgi:NitT/TauT family transport system substrate-binding protein